MSLEIFYGSDTFAKVLDVPIVTDYRKHQRALYKNKGNVFVDAPVIARTFSDDDKVFLAYQEVTLIPGGDSRFLAQRSAEIASKIGKTGHFTAVDVGTGCGIFATYLSEAVEDNPEAQVIATDISGAALEVAELNFALNEQNKPAVLRRRDLLTDIAFEFGKVNLIVSNPPFTPAGHVPQNEFEPKIAHDGGSDGVDLYRRLLQQSSEILADNAVILLQATQIGLPRVLSCVTTILPSAHIGYIQNPQTDRLCGIIVGDRKITEEFSTGILV